MVGGQTIFSNLTSAGTRKLSSKPKESGNGNELLMPLLFRRLIGKKDSMYGSTHSDCDASSVGEASVSLLPPTRSPTHQESNKQSSRWQRDAWCLALVAFTMAAIAAALGAYVIFIKEHNGGAGGSVIQAAATKGQGGAVRRPLPVVAQSEALKPP